MKKLIVYTDGGLGNRLGTLLGAMYLEKYFERELIINWPINNWCGCRFDKLFDYNALKEELIMPVFLEKYKNKTFITHETQPNFLGNQLCPPYKHNIDYVKLNLNSNDIILYNNNNILDFLSEDEVLAELSRLNIKQNILEYVKIFCDENKICKNVIGIHIRKTDGGLQNINEYIFKQHIESNKNQRYFICSDDKETEEYYSNYENVVVHIKNKYVEKLNKDSGWNTNITDINGKTYPFNVKRSEESVIEAFLDLLILSKTTLLKDGINVGSTFLKISSLYSKLNYE